MNNLNLIIEVSAVLTGLAYVVLLMKENIWCWIFGIISSLLSIWLFVYAKIYAEAFLYFYYVVMGIYGWMNWNRYEQNDQELKISEYGIQQHILWISLAAICTFLMSYIFGKFTDAARPLIDSATTVFAFVATYLQTQKIRSNWLFWIGINAVSVWLYYDRALYIYAGLMFVYLVLAIFGYRDWTRKLKQQEN